MSLLVVNEIEKSFGIDTILSGISFRLEWRQKMGLVGRNGSGKTTLLRILTGQMEPDRGTVTYARGVRFGYLRQEQMVEHGWTVYEEAQDAFAPVLAMEQRLRDLEHQMAEAHDAEHDERLQDVMEEYGLLRDRFEAMGGYESLRDIGLVLQRLGFGAGDLDKPTTKLSGGEKTRLAVAKLLLSAPDVLLLDEPTNHLDLQATEWLEGFLHDFGGAVILVSHDRYFLDRVVSDVAEVDNARLTQYRGNFSAYWTQRLANRKRQLEVYERQQEEIARLEEFWRRNKAGQNRNLAWSRLKMANRLRDQGLERPQDAQSLKVALREGARSGNEVVIADKLTKRFGGRTLFDHVSLLVLRGQRVGIVGPNGAGKSTFVRMLVGEDTPTSGHIRLGASVTAGYFAQEASELDLESTVIDSIMDEAEMTPGEARNYLARFLFFGDDVFRTVADLSGGEKNRLALALLVLARPNLLILDEPTNHLDIDSRDALTEMLREYNGTLLLVSHDRYLLDQVTTTTLEIADGHARFFDGPYATYRLLKEKQRTQPAAAADATPSRTLENRKSEIENPLTAGMSSYQLSKERQKAVKAVSASEAKVSEAEDWMKRIEEALSAPSPGDDLVKLAHDYERAQGELAEAMAAWEKAVEYAEGIGAAV